LGYYSDDLNSYFAEIMKEFPESFTEQDRLPNDCQEMYREQDFALPELILDHYVKKAPILIIG